MSPTTERWKAADTRKSPRVEPLDTATRVDVKKTPRAGPSDGGAMATDAKKTPRAPPVAADTGAKTPRGGSGDGVATFKSPRFGGGGGVGDVAHAEVKKVSPTVREPTGCV